MCLMVITTGEQIRWDPAKEGANGLEGKNHWHRLNPESKNKLDTYLDKNGNPVPRGSGPSHIGAPQIILLPEVIIKPEKRTFLRE